MKHYNNTSYEARKVSYRQETPWGRTSHLSFLLTGQTPLINLFLIIFFKYTQYLFATFDLCTLIIGKRKIYMRGWMLEFTVQALLHLGTFLQNSQIHHVRTSVPAKNPAKIQCTVHCARKTSGSSSDVPKNNLNLLCVLFQGTLTLSHDLMQVHIF